MDSKYLHKLACVRQTCTICLPVSSEASNDLKNQISGLHIDSRILLHRSSSSEAVSTADHSARPSVATTNISLDGSTLACAAPSYKEIHHAQCESMESAPITEYSSKHRDRFSADEDTSSAQHTGLLRSLTNMTPPSKFTLPFQPPPPAPRRRHTCISSMCIHSSGHQTALSRSAGSPCNKQRRQRGKSLFCIIYILSGRRLPRQEGDYNISSTNDQNGDYLEATYQADAC